MLIEETDTSTEAAIRQVVEDAVAHQSDVDPFLALHTDDVVLVNFAGRRVIGKEVLREAMTAALATPLADVITTNKILHITHLRPDAVLVSCLKRVTDHNAPESQVGGLPTEASLTYLMTQDDHGWRIALAQTTPIR